jgi:NADPH:quinone reductase-like Zn-dependent oxidoreductase
MRVDLPNGQWAEVKDPDELVEDDRKAARKMLDVATDSEGNWTLNASMGDLMREGVITAVVTAWSFEGKPVPSQLPGVLGSLPIRTVRALRRATQEHYDLIWGSDDDEDPTGEPTS